MNIKELLPAIGGFAVGAVSPQAGESLANTLEMADAIKQRKRRQGIEDETLERTRESHDWQRAREERAVSDQDREDQERALAVSMGPKILETFKQKGWDIGPEYANVILNPDSLEQQLQAASAATGQEYRELEMIDKTPVDDAGIEQIRQSLDPGDGQWVYTRLPGGGLDRRFIMKPQVSSKSSESDKVAKAILGKFMEVRQAVQEATLAGNEMSRATQFGQPTKMEPTENVSSGGSIKVTKAPTDTQYNAVPRAILNIQQQTEELAMYAMLYPEQYNQILSILGNSIVPEEMMDQFNIDIPGREPVERTAPAAGAATEDPTVARALALADRYK